MVLSDRNTTPLLGHEIPPLEAAGVSVRLGHSYSPDDPADLVVVSPGVPWDIPALMAARDRGVTVIGEAECAWRDLKDRPWVGITGTNGKTTTTALTAAIFQGAGLNAPACGNIGNALCEVALGDTLPDWVVAELSSYQIEASSTLAPKIGLWTTFTPDHLERHYTLENYFNIKAKLLHQSETTVFNGDDPYLRTHVPARFPNAWWTSLHGREAIAPLQPLAYVEAGWVKINDTAIVAIDALRMTGRHNQQNLLLAVAAAHLAGIDKAAIAEAVAQFPGVPHRLEHITTWKGINFINDSKATNYDAAEVALAAVTAPTVLIAGGQAKAGDDSAWLGAIRAKVVKVLLIGNAATTFATRLESTNFQDYEVVETMEQAVKRSAEIAPTLGAKNVLLSPACASFDQYPNFERRGDHFRELCQQLLKN